MKRDAAIINETKTRLLLPRHGFWGPLTHELFAVASQILIFYAYIAVELYKAEREHIFIPTLYWEQS